MAARTRRTLETLPPWTKHRNEGSGAELSLQCLNHLVSIEQAFCKVSSLAMEFLRQEGWKFSYAMDSTTILLIPPKEVFKDTSVFKGDDIENLEQHIQEVTTRKGNNLTGLTMRLTKTEIIDAWKKFTILLAKTQAYNESYREWIPCKQRALDVLELHDKVAVRFENIQDELQRARHHDLIEALMEKLSCLARFDAIYNRQGNRTEPIYTVHEVRKRKKDDQSTSENERPQIQTMASPEQGRQDATAHQQPDTKLSQVPSVVAVVLVTIIISTIPLILAWRISGASPGTASDVDFYLLIQNSIMQLLGLFTAIFPLAKQSPSTAWRWAKLFTIIGAIFAVAAVPIYLYLPTMWSALASFVGSVSQIAVILELALIADMPASVFKSE